MGEIPAVSRTAALKVPKFPFFALSFPKIIYSSNFATCFPRKNTIFFEKSFWENAVFPTSAGFLWKSKSLFRLDAPSLRKPQNTQNTQNIQNGLAFPKERKPFACYGAFMFLRRQADCHKGSTHEDLRRSTTFLGNIAFDNSDGVDDIDGIGGESRRADASSPA